MEHEKNLTWKREVNDFIRDLELRGIIRKIANQENITNLGEKNKSVYLGIDCTGENLHLGHLYQIIQLFRFTKLGFKPILLLGGATSQIGDPSDKEKERPKLEREKVFYFREKIKEQIIFLKGKISFEKFNFLPLEKFFSEKRELLKKIWSTLKIEPNSTYEKKWADYFNYIHPFFGNLELEIVDNEEWIKNINFVEFINKAGRNISVNYLLAKENIKNRLKGGLSYAEFSYSLIQAYDFFYLSEERNCYGQLGGSDQWGNITTGLKLIRGIKPDSNCFGIVFDLLTDKKGKKYSKSEAKDNFPWLRKDNKQLYDFFRNLEDNQAEQLIKKLTFINENQLNELKILNNPSSMRILQRILYELVFIFTNKEMPVYFEEKNKKNEFAK